MIAKLMTNGKFLIILWAALFVATVLSSGLDFRSLLAAFFAWAGGIVTARITHEQKLRRIMKDMHEFAREEAARGEFHRA